MKRALIALYLSIPVQSALFLLGYAVFVVRGKTPAFAYESMRLLYWKANGRVHEAVAWLHKTMHPKRRLRRADGILGSLDDAYVRRIARAIARDGFVVFEQRLDPATCDRLTELALSVPARLSSPRAPGAPEEAIYDEKCILSPRYDFSEPAILASPVAQALAVDRSLLAVAQEYLGCEPIHDATQMWWTAVFPGGPSSKAAQLYHYDMDRVKFLKFFFYLTTVDTRTGPHCFVRGSHRKKPRDLRRDGRFTDEEVQRSFPRDVREIIGPRGTIMAVDTSGFHKGKMVEHGHRLMLEFQFSSSLFGINYGSAPLASPSGPIREALARFPYTFSRFRIASIASGGRR